MGADGDRHRRRLWVFIHCSSLHGVPLCVVSDLVRGTTQRNATSTTQAWTTIDCEVSVHLTAPAEHGAAAAAAAAAADVADIILKPLRYNFGGTTQASSVMGVDFKPLPYVLGTSDLP